MQTSLQSMMKPHAPCPERSHVKACTRSIESPDTARLQPRPGSTDRALASHVRATPDGRDGSDSRRRRPRRSPCRTGDSTQPRSSPCARLAPTSRIAYSRRLAAVRCGRDRGRRPAASRPEFGAFAVRGHPGRRQRGAGYEAIAALRRGEANRRHPCDQTRTSTSRWTARRATQDTGPSRCLTLSASTPPVTPRSC